MRFAIHVLFAATLTGASVGLGWPRLHEPDESCSPGHPCPDASGAEAKAELTRLASGHILTCEKTGMSYKRTTAWCWREDGLELNCAMVRSGKALAWPKFDPRDRLCRQRAPER